MNISDEIALIALLKIPKVGNRTAFNMFKNYNSNFQTEKEFYNFIKRNIEKGIKFPDINQDLISKSLDYSYSIHNKSKDLDISIISINHKDYPNRLKSIDNPPLILFAKGNISALKQDICTAVIGKRNPSNYGFIASKKIGEELSKNSIVVVSGLAAGCDTQAHIGCIEEKGIGIGVLAHGLDMIYPSSSTPIADNLIANNGLLISEYPIGVQPTKYNFVDRDRIQSGISDIVFVIETNEDGGTMHTVKHSLAQNRKIACVEFPEEAYFNGIAKGNRLLIKEKKAIPFHIDDNVNTFIENINFDDQFLSNKDKLLNEQKTFDF